MEKNGNLCDVMITVLMPTYNCACFLTTAIDSILKQSYSHFEFLIIDDGSFDDTDKIISNFTDNRIKYIKKKHTGLADSLNFGLEVAKYDFIARMDADDIAHPFRIEKQLMRLRNKSENEIVASWFAVFSKKKIKYIVKTPEDDSEIKKSLALYSTIPHSGCMYNRKIILENNGYKEEYFEDYSMWLQIKNKSKFYNIQEVLTFVRYRADSLSRKDLVKKNQFIYNIQEQYYQNIMFHFPIQNSDEKNRLKGWREYFYGNPKLARKYWKKEGANIFSEYKILLAFLFSFLPVNVLTMLKESRVRFRIEYLLKYFSSQNKILRGMIKSRL